MNRSRALLVLTVVLATAALQLSGAERAAAPPLLTFTDISAGLTGVYGGSVAWGDYNSDGKLDILLTGSDSGSVPVSKIYKNNGNGTFSEDATAESGLVGVAASSVAWGDYNSDGSRTSCSRATPARSLSARSTRTTVTAPSARIRPPRAA